MVNLCAVCRSDLIRMLLSVDLDAPVDVETKDDIWGNCILRPNGKVPTGSVEIYFCMEVSV